MLHRGQNNIGEHQSDVQSACDIQMSPDFLFLPLFTSHLQSGLHRPFLLDRPHSLQLLGLCTRPPQLDAYPLPRVLLPDWLSCVLHSSAQSPLLRGLANLKWSLIIRWLFTPVEFSAQHSPALDIFLLTIPLFIIHYLLQTPWQVWEQATLPQCMACHRCSSLSPGLFSW